MPRLRRSPVKLLLGCLLVIGNVLVASRPRHETATAHALGSDGGTAIAAWRRPPAPRSDPASRPLGR
jgi:hypothetical protein